MRLGQKNDFLIKKTCSESCQTKNSNSFGVRISLDKWSDQRDRLTNCFVWDFLFLTMKLSVVRYEQVVVSSEDVSEVVEDISSETLNENSFTQLAADNTDGNIATLTGNDTFRGMAQ